MLRSLVEVVLAPPPPWIFPLSKRCCRVCFSRRRRLRRDRQHIRRTGQLLSFFRQSCAPQALHIERADRRKEDVLSHMGLPTHVLQYINWQLKASSAVLHSIKYSLHSKHDHETYTCDPHLPQTPLELPVLFAPVQLKPFRNQ